MSRRRKEFKEKHVRIRMNQVSSELEYTILDNVEKTFERFQGLIGASSRKSHPTDENGDRRRLTELEFGLGVLENDRLIGKIVAWLIPQLSCGITDSENTEVGRLQNLVMTQEIEIEFLKDAMAKALDKEARAGVVLVEALAS
jgi:hypothetical protein